MTTTTRTARIAHRCDDCHRKTIAPGHRYLRNVMFPGDINTSGKPWTSRRCIACLADRDPAAPLITAGACATFCCGVTPCARPFDHDGDHECRHCLVGAHAPAPAPSRPHHDEPRHGRPVTTVHLPDHDIA